MMEWFVSLITGLLGWAAGQWQSSQDKRHGIEMGAQAALHIELGLMPVRVSYDDAKLKPIIKDIKLDDYSAVIKASTLLGEAYCDIIRRDAFEDCRANHFTDADRDEWKRAFGEDMPPISYEDGYNQALRDVVWGISGISSNYFEQEVVAEIVDRVADNIEVITPTTPEYLSTLNNDAYSDKFDSNGKILGALLAGYLLSQAKHGGE